MVGQPRGHAAQQPAQVCWAALAGSGIEGVKSCPRNPGANAHAERRVCTAGAEITNQLLIAWPRHVHAMPVRAGQCSSLSPCVAGVLAGMDALLAAPASWAPARTAAMNGPAPSRSRR
jgi:hypothetical protein